MTLNIDNARAYRQDPLGAEALLGAVIEEADEDGEGALSSVTIRLKDGRRIYLHGSGQIEVDSIFLGWEDPAE
ncbi:MAG: hypothetical protein WC277_08935 [Bacilli bacterium]